MFHSKQDVDRHVNEVFRNIKSEYQRNLKCYQIAKLYYKFKDYKAALKYINRYILTTTNSAAAHRLLGECYLGLNLKVKAIEAFKTSLVLNGSQNDLVLKICTLLMDPEVSTVTPRATYWLERAETLFPTNPIVFQLKEHLLKSNFEGKQDMGQLEKLILSEISVRPADVAVRIRLLNFFVDTKRYKIAYQHALEIEERNIFSHDLRWYDCLCNVVQAYEKASGDLGFSFFIRKIIFFEKRADLFMQEFQEEIKTLSECSSALFAFDQNLHSFSKIEAPQEDKYFFLEFLKHMRAQLSFHLATLVLKRAKKEYGIWPKALRSASPLLLQATQSTMDLEGAWYSMWSGKNKLEKEVNQLNKNATLRISQAGHVLLAWSQSKGPKFLEKVSQFCGGKWQTHVYQDVFYNREHQQAVATSHFVNDPFFADVPMRLLTETELSHFDEVSQSAYPDSLHHLVWLGLAYCSTTGNLSHDFRCTTVPDLQFSIANLSQAGPETLNQLDVDAFLYASVLCAKSSASSVVSTDKPNRLPVNISEELCSPAQADWWVAVYKTYTNQTSGNIADMRLKLRKGIEVIRVFGQHGLHPKIMVSLAKLFQERAAKNKNPSDITALEDRAFMYWSAAVPSLEKMEKNQQLREVPNRLFDYRGKDLTPSEIKAFLEDGRLFLACRLMKQGRHEQAIEAFQSLKSPYATFYQALMYEELASQEISHRPESITSENRSQHIILLTRARDALYLTLDRLRCPSVDPNHALNTQLQDHLDQIERQLAKIDLDVNLKSGDSQSDETDTAPGPLGSDVDETLESSFNIYNTSNFLSVKNQSSSRPTRQNLPEKHSSTRFEARPSPERLDAQLRHLVQANSNGLQAIVEQLKEMKSTMQIELKDLGCVTRDLLAEMKRWNHRLETVSKRTTDILKPEDLFDLREEEYEDLNQLSHPYSPYTNYQVNRQMTGTQGTSTVTYGASVPSPIPSIPPVIAAPENPLIPPAFYPGAHPVPALDPSVLVYQSLGLYPPGISYGENQNSNDFRGMGIQKGAPFAKNAFKVPVDTVPSAAVSTTKVQPPNVVITSSDTLPAFTSVATPTMSVTVPPQHIRGLAPTTVTLKSSQNQVHPFQIQMPPQAQTVKESPTENLNSLTPNTSLFTTPIIPNANQMSSDGEKIPAKSELPINKINEGKFLVEDKHKENNLFSAKGRLSVFDKNWSEKKSVSIKIVNETPGKARIVIQQDSGFMILDNLITADVEIKPLAKSENGWVLSVRCSEKPQLFFGEQQQKNSKLKEFRIYFDTSNEVKEFENALKEGYRSNGINLNQEKQATPTIETKNKECVTCKKKVEGSAEKCSSCLIAEKSTEKVNLGGFTFNSAPIVKPSILKINEEKEAPKETSKPSLFSSFSFSTPTTTFSETNTQSKTTTALPFTGANITNQNLFAEVKADPNSFKKDANFKGFEGKGSLVFGYLNKSQSPSANALKTNKNDNGEDDFVPTAEFTPVVDLPDLVDVKTGEENDKVLYDERVKLLRFDTVLKEWKERGVGQMRVLLNEENGKVRLIMRRELVLKVCCNHYLNEKMEFKRMKNSQKALTWYAQDYSEGEIKGELFALKFADPESMVRFETAVSKVQSEMQDGRMKDAIDKNATEKKPEALKPLSELFKPKPFMWECESCLVKNENTVTRCVCCQTPKPGTESLPVSLPTVSLEGGISITPSPMKFSFGIPQPSTTASPSISMPTTTFTFGIPQDKTSTGFSSLALQSNTINANSTNPGTPFIKFGIPQGTGPTSDSSSAEVGSLTNTFSSGLISGGAKSSNTPVSKPTEIFSSTSSSNTSEIFKTGVPFSSSTSFSSSPGIFTTGAAQSVPLVKTLSQSSSPSFTFSKPGAAPTPCTFSIFPKENKSNNDTTTSKWIVPNSDSKGEKKEVFGFSFGNFKATTPDFTSQKTKSSSPKKNESPGKTTQEDSGGEENPDESEENVNDEDDNVIVKPIIPLPEKVAPHTGEEEEVVLYEQRAKLFRFVDKEWKERGIGAIKILKHKEHNKIRMLMRRETILKVCLNHYLTPDVQFKSKDEKTWTWTAADFSEGKVECTLFAIRFKTSDIAQEFKKAIDDAQKDVRPSLIKEENTKDLSAAMKAFTFAVPEAAKNESPMSSKSNKSEEDVVVVYEKKVTPEQREKAISLNLPPNFYAYLQAPDCPGCSGCDKDDEPVQSEQTTAAVSNNNSFFGSKPWGSLNFMGGDISQRKVLFTFPENQGKTTWDTGLTALNLTLNTKKENESEVKDETEVEAEDVEDEAVEDEAVEDEEEEEDEDEDEEDEDDEDEEEDDDEKEEYYEEDEDVEGKDLDEQEDEEYGKDDE